MRNKYKEDYFFFQAIKDYCVIVSFKNGLNTNNLNDIKFYNNFNINTLTTIGLNIKTVINTLKMLNKEMYCDTKRTEESINFLNEFYNETINEIDSFNLKEKRQAKTSNIDKRRKNMINER